MSPDNFPGIYLFWTSCATREFDKTRHRPSFSLLVLTTFYFRSSQIMRIIYIIT